MKHKLSKEEFDKLSDDFKKEYKAEGEEYVLTVEGLEDNGALKRAKDYEKEKRQKAEAKLRETEDKVVELEDKVTELQGSAPDTKKLEESWKQKLDKVIKEKDEANAVLVKEIERMCVDDVSSSVARDLSDSPDVLTPHIKSRLMVEMEGGKAKTRIKDADGNPSALTLDELKTEFRSNASFAAVIKGSEGSGSGANGGQGGKGNGQSQGGSQLDLTTASTKEIVAHRKANQKQQNSGA